MDFTNLSSEDVKNLSPEEKREFVRSLIHSEAAEVHAAFFNPHTKQTVGMRELAEQIGEEEAIDLIVKMIDSAKTETLTMTKDEIKDLMLRAKRGDCTEHELHMLQYITERMEEEDNIQFERNFMDIVINLIDFAQSAVPYEPQLHDAYSAMVVLTVISMINSENSALAKYNNTDGPMVSEMATHIADDIYNTWSASCTSPVDTELVILGLLQLAAKLAFEKDYKFAKAQDMADAIGVDLSGEFERVGEDEIDEASEQDTANGSNTEAKICQPIIHDPSDENMRDLLKD